MLILDTSIWIEHLKSKSKIWTLDQKLLKVLPKELNYEENHNII